MYNKTTITFGFCDFQNNESLGKGYLHQPLASAKNPYLDLDYSSQTPHPIIVYYLEWLSNIRPSPFISDYFLEENQSLHFIVT